MLCVPTLIGTVIFCLFLPQATAQSQAKPGGAGKVQKGPAAGQEKGGKKKGAVAGKGSKRKVLGALAHLQRAISATGSTSASFVVPCGVAHGDRPTHPPPSRVACAGTDVHTQRARQTAQSAVRSTPCPTGRQRHALSMLPSQGLMAKQYTALHIMRSLTLSPFNH